MDITTRLRTLIWTAGGSISGGPASRCCGASWAAAAWARRSYPRTGRGRAAESREPRLLRIGATDRDRCPAVEPPGNGLSLAAHRHHRMGDDRRLHRQRAQAGRARRACGHRTVRRALLPVDPRRRDRDPLRPHALGSRRGRDGRSPPGGAPRCSCPLHRTGWRATVAHGNRHQRQRPCQRRAPRHRRRAREQGPQGHRRPSERGAQDGSSQRRGPARTAGPVAGRDPGFALAESENGHARGARHAERRRGARRL